MRLFKSVDDKLEELGFVKISEDVHGIEYERYNNKFDFTQVVHIGKKVNPSMTILQSYDKDLFDTKKIGNTCVGLEEYEVKLFHKKMKQFYNKVVRKEIK